MSVVANVENAVESDRADPADHRHATRVQVLGPLTIVREGVALALPASRKVRALIAYLTLAPRAVARSRLCQLLWDIPNDPRGELRWCLSKARSVLDEPDRRRVKASAEGVALDLSDCFVDAVEIERAAREGIDRLAPERLRALSTLFVGDFLEGLEIDRNPEFNSWLTAQRCRFRGCEAAALEHLLASIPPDSEDVFGYLDQWLQIAPFDRRAHEQRLNALAVRGRIQEGDAHVAAAARLFEAEGLDCAPIRSFWKAQRRQPASAAGDGGLVAVSSAAPLILGANDINEIATSAPRHRASIAVMPFDDRTEDGDTSNRLAGALAHDVITRLAKLRHFFVIAHGTMAALGQRSVGTEQAGRILNVDYVAGGSLRRRKDRLTIHIELIDTRSARIVWAEVFDRKLDEAFLVLDEIGNHIVASIESEIELAERNHAILKPPSSLTAWEAYHRGLWHLYRYRAEENRLAQQMFEMAVRLDPTWARAHAALSSCHWQKAFRRWSDREQEIDRTFAAAEQSLAADERDPSAHWAMGRALWLRGRHDQSLFELEKSVELSPSFAHGHYALAFGHAQSGDPHIGIGSIDHSRQLSPFDPMLFAFLGTRAMALLRLGQFEEAADYAVKAALRPNAFSHIRAMAAACLALAGKLDEARGMAASIHETLPHYRVDDLLATFQFEPKAAELYRKGAKRIGLG